MRIGKVDGLSPKRCSLREHETSEGTFMTQTVVITGASAGVARATARLYGERGARVGLIARGQAGLDGAAADIRDAGGTALPISADVADYEQVDRAASRIEAEFGPIDVWINVAFTSVFAPFADITPDEFRRVTEVSYLGFVHGTMAALARMRPRDRGTIVQVGSALSARSIPLQSAYCGAKHAINGFTSSLRCELLHDGSHIHVTVVQLPAVNTPQFSWVKSKLPHEPQPVPPIYQPEVAARGIVYAADHPGRREYWVGASTAATLAANKFAPGLLDRYLARTGYSSQQTSEPADSDRPDNLVQAVDEPPGTDHGAHGHFDGRSHGRSAQLWVSHNRALCTLAGCGAAAAAAVVAAVRR
jgi:NAD(P)-dependent dehydrogenase (short-subunit alcohol dehydrogenase family)